MVPFTPAMQELISLSFEIGLGDRSTQEKREHLSGKHDVIHQAIKDALDRAGEDFETAMSLLDSGKSMVTRDMLFRRRMGGDKDASGAAVMAMSKPQFVKQFVGSSPEIALCNFYLGPEGEFRLLLAQNLGPDRPMGEVMFNLTEAAKNMEFPQKLQSYITRSLGKPPDFELQAELLQFLGSALIPFFLKHKPPRKLFLIPHRGLHLLPLHAMFVDTGKERLFLDNIVPEIMYASCLTELLYSNVKISASNPAQEQREPKILAALDIEAPGLSWINTEQRQFEALRALGYPVEIITKDKDIPEDYRSYVVMNWSGHAASDAFSWGGSMLTFGRQQISAATISHEWDLSARPLVTLAACESAANHSMAELLDEYCGLDRAFKIAGARQVLAALWPIADPLGALASITMPIWTIQHNVSAAHALVIFQSNLRMGIWKQWLLTDDQLQKAAEVSRDAAEKLREAQQRFKALDNDAFSHPRHWSAFRCYGN
jgi:CHAT domain-containing protein